MENISHCWHFMNLGKLWHGVCSFQLIRDHLLFKEWFDVFYTIFHNRKKLLKIEYRKIDWLDLIWATSFCRWLYDLVYGEGLQSCWINFCLCLVIFLMYAVKYHGSYLWSWLCCCTDFRSPDATIKRGGCVVLMFYGVNEDIVHVWPKPKMSTIKINNYFVCQSWKQACYLFSKQLMSYSQNK